MLQRVGIAQALVNDPEVVFLDEPMSGLDPLGRRDVRQLLLSLRDEGRTLFFSSHILGDAEAICSRVAILSEGRLVATGRLSELGLRVRGWELVVTGTTESRARSLVSAADSIRCIGDDRHVIELPADCTPEAVITPLVESGARILSLNPHHETLEEFFVDQVTRRREQDEERRVSA